MQATSLALHLLLSTSHLGYYRYNSSISPKAPSHLLHLTPPAFHKSSTTLHLQKRLLPFHLQKGVRNTRHVVLWSVSHRQQVPEHLHQRRSDRCKGRGVLLRKREQHHPRTNKTNKGTVQGRIGARLSRLEIALATEPVACHRAPDMLRSPRHQYAYPAAACPQHSTATTYYFNSSEKLHYPPGFILNSHYCCRDIQGVDLYILSRASIVLCLRIHIVRRPVPLSASEPVPFREQAVVILR